MNYRLILESAGDWPALERTYESVRFRARGRMSEVVIASAVAEPPPILNPAQLVLGSGKRGRSRLATIRDAWEDVAAAGADVTLWMPEGYRFVQALDLDDVAGVLFAEPRLAQMGLGGAPRSGVQRGSGTVAWIEHAGSWAWPCVVPRRIAAGHRWPETVLSEEAFRESLPRTTTLGVWGVGEPWTRRE